MKRLRDDVCSCATRARLLKAAVLSRDDKRATVEVRRDWDAHAAADVEAAHHGCAVEWEGGVGRHRSSKASCRTFSASTFSTFMTPVGSIVFFGEETKLATCRGCDQLRFRNKIFSQGRYHVSGATSDPPRQTAPRGNRQCNS